MKVILASLMFLTSTAALSVNADGCFVTYVVGAMYPAICVSGSNEEAAFPTTRVAIFGTNTDNVAWCARVNSQARLSYEKNENHVEFGFDHATGMKSILFNGKAEGSREKGSIIFNEVKESIELEYSRLDEETTKRLLVEMYKSEKCDNL